MNKAKIFLTIGIWVSILPYLGFPLFFKNILFTVTGLILMYLAYILFKESKILNKKKKSFDSFSENQHFLAKEEEKEENSLEENN